MSPLPANPLCCGYFYCPFCIAVILGHVSVSPLQRIQMNVFQENGCGLKKMANLAINKWETNRIESQCYGFGWSFILGSLDICCLILSFLLSFSVCCS